KTGDRCSRGRDHIRPAEDPCRKDGREGDCSYRDREEARISRPGRKRARRHWARIACRQTAVELEVRGRDGPIGSRAEQGRVGQQAFNGGAPPRLGIRPAIKLSRPRERQRICAILQLGLQAHEPRAVDRQYGQADDHDEHHGQVRENDSASVVPEGPGGLPVNFAGRPTCDHGVPSCSMWRWWGLPAAAAYLRAVVASSLLRITEYSLASPFRMMVIFTWFDGGAGAAATGGGGGGATGRTGSGMMRPISRSPMRRLASPADSFGRLRIKDSLPTFVASKIFCACSLVTSNVTARATVGFSSPSLAIWSIASTFRCSNRMSE